MLGSKFLTGGRNLFPTGKPGFGQTTDLKRCATSNLELRSQDHGITPTADSEQVMRNAGLDKAWEEGFKAGEVVSRECPYAKDTPQARNWFEGWSEGAAKALGFPYSRTYAEKLQGVRHAD